MFKTKAEIIQEFEMVKGASVGSQLSASDGSLCVVTVVDTFIGQIADIEILKKPTVGQSFQPQRVDETASTEKYDVSDAPGATVRQQD